MYPNSIVSLCFVSKQNDKTTELCRIADFYNDGFEPYKYDSTYDFYGTERDLIYGARKDISGEIGSISVYVWSAHQDSNNEWRTTTHESNVPWIEVISTFKDTPEQVVEMIKSGIKLTMPAFRKHDIIVCCRAKGAYAEAVYIPADGLICENDFYTFSEDVVAVETAEINYYEDTASCRCRYNQSDAVRYLVRPGSWRATGQVTVHSPREIVSAAVVTYARRLDKDRIITRKERQSFASVVDKLSAVSISDDVMTRLHCTRDDAVHYIEDYLADLSNRMKRNEADWVMRQLIENNSEYEQEMYKRVEENWHQAHASARAEWEAEFRKAQENLEDVQRKTVDAQSELAKAQEGKAQCEADTLKTLQLQEDIEKRIQERLASIHSDRAKALVDETWTMAAMPYAPVGESKRNRTWLFDYDGQDHPIDEVPLSDRWMDAVSQWEHINANDSRGVELAAFFLSTYAIKQHLIISGECAELIADVASRIVAGRNCAKVCVMDYDSVPEIIQEIAAVPHDCICFLDGLEQNHHAVKAIMRHFSDSQFIITAPHYESLTMEPASFFTTFLPVCSEEFCVATATPEMDALSCRLELRTDTYKKPNSKQLRAVRAEQTTWFASGFFAPMLVDRCARLHCAMKTMLSAHWADGEKEAKRAMLGLVYVPLMRCLRRKDILEANLAEFDVLDEALKNRLLAFAGIEKE